MLRLTNLGLDGLSRTESALVDSGLADYIIGALRASISYCAAYPIHGAPAQYVVLGGRINSCKPFDDFFNKISSSFNRYTNS